MCDTVINEKRATALSPVVVDLNPGDKYDPEARLWQGIPGIECTLRGRLWAVWYSGGKTEGSDNYVQVVRSEDEGSSWSAPVLVVDPPGLVRAFDPVLWMDPCGKLWFFWAQSYGMYDGRIGVWAIHTDDPDGDSPKWTEPRRLCNGIMMNKPTALSSGEWLLCVAIWQCHKLKLDEYKAERKSNVYCSVDNGAAWELRGGQMCRIGVMTSIWSSRADCKSKCPNWNPKSASCC